MIYSISMMVTFPVNSTLLVVKFWERKKLYVDFQLHEGLAPVTSMLFKGQLYIEWKKMDLQKFSFYRRKILCWVYNMKKDKININVCFLSLFLKCYLQALNHNWRNSEGNKNLVTLSWVGRHSIHSSLVHLYETGLN